MIPTVINVGIYIISIGNFEFTKGTYVLDFHLMSQWENQDISPTNFEFMNGRTTSKEKNHEAMTNSSTCLGNKHAYLRGHVPSKQSIITTSAALT